MKIKLTVFALLMLVFTSINFAQLPISPTAGSTQVPVATANVTFTDFNDGSGNGPYDIEFSFDNTGLFGTIDASSYNTVATSLPLPVLSNNTIYYWRVRDTDIDGGGADGIWYVYSFATFTTPTTVPTNLAVNVSMATSLSWNAFGENGSANGPYDVEFHGTDNTYGGIPINSSYATVSLTQSIGTLSPLTTFYWRVRDADISPAPGNQPGTWQNRSFTTHANPTPSPAGGTTGVSQALTTLSWSAFDEGGAGNGNYDVEFYGTDNTYTTVVSSSPNQAGTSFLHGATLAYNTTYYWRVRDTDVDGLGGNGSWLNYSFTTEIATPALSAPTNTAVDLAIPVNLSWSLAGGTGGVTYDLEYHTGGGFPGTIVPGVTSAYAFGGLTNNTTYTWRIIAKKAGEADKPSLSRTFTTELGTPTLTAPVNGSVNQLVTPTFNWTLPGSSSGVVFNLEYHTGGGFPGTFVNNVTSGYNGTTFNGNTTVTWRVHATKPSFTTKTALPIFSFTTIPSPILNTPANLATAVSVTPNFTWSWPFPGAPTYTIEIATDMAFTSIVYGPVAATSPHLLPDLNALSNSTIYYWRVTATLPGPVVSSSIGTFTTITSARPVLLTPVHLAQIVGNILNFQWTMPSTGIKYKVELDDNSDFSSQITGFPTAFTSLNYYNLPYTLTLLPAGSYFWRVKSYTSADELISISSAWMFTIPGPPTAVPAYPINSQTVYTISPLVYWYLNNYFYNSAVYYRVRYGTTQGGPYNLTSPTTTGQYVALSGLTAGNDYYWVVDASSSPAFPVGPTTTTSNEATFMVYYSPITLNGITIYLSYPAGGSTIYTTTPTFYWFLGMQIPGITFDLQIDNSGPGFPSPEVNAAAISAYEYTSAALTPGSTYNWRVRISGATSWYGPETFTVHSSATNSTSTSGVAIPTLASPLSGTVVNTQSPTLNWSSFSTSPVDYQVIWSTNPSVSVSAPYGLSNITAPNGGTSGWLVTSSYTLSALTPGVTYYWQVRARLSSTPATMSNYSSVGQFTVSAGASPVVVLPANPIIGSIINSNAATLSWVVPAKSTSLLTYDLEISKNKEMTGALTINNLKQPNYQADNLEANTKYYWRVRSKTSGGILSNYSYSGQFSTGSATDSKEEVELPTQFELAQNYPNPFNPSTIIAFSIPNQSYVSLKIFDILGREIRTLVNSDMSAGKYTVNWNGDDNNGNKVATGTYIYRITAGAFVSTKKMILIK